MAESGAKGQGLRLVEVSPTVFFAREGAGVGQGVDLSLANDGPAAVDAELLFAAEGRVAALPLGALPPGESARRVYVPDLRQPTTAEWVLRAGGAIQDRRAMDWTPARHWEVHIVQRSHHDLGYTDLPSQVLRDHDAFLDDALRFCDQTADWPDESQFRYVVEQGWSALHYVANRPPDSVARFSRLAREGRIEVTALFANETSELCSHEEQIRLLYPSLRLKRRLGIPLRTAQLNDIPGASWGLVSVLAGAGIRYLAPMLPDYFAWGARKVYPFWDEQAVLPRDMSGAFWWEGPDRSRVLLWYGQGPGGLWSYDTAVRDLSRRLGELDARGYPYDLLRCHISGGGRDNAPAVDRFSLIAREWNSRWAYPRLIVSTDTRFFASFEARYGAGLPVLRGDLPNTDYTVGALSTARETGVNRRTHETLTAAEKWAACAAAASDYPYPADTLAEAYDAELLFDEHTWGMAHPIGPAQEGCWAQKSELAYRAAALAHDVLVKATNRLADQVRLPEEGYHLVVFNPLARERTDLVRALALQPAPAGRPMYWRTPQPPDGSASAWVNGTAIGRNVISLPAELLERPFALIDVATGESVPYQVLRLADPLAPQPDAAARYALGHLSPASVAVLNYSSGHLLELAFVARDVPALGYKTYRLAPVAEWPRFESSLRASGHALESRFYRVELDPATGAVTSLYDKVLGREWADAAAEHGFHQVLMRSPVTGEVAAAGDSEIAVGEAGPVLASLVIRGAAPGCPQRAQEITLYDGLKRVDFATRLLKDATPYQELYLAFPFALEGARFRYRAANSVIEPIRDQLPGSNTDAYAAQQWVQAADARGSVTWSSLEAPVVVLGQLWPGYVSQAHHGITPPGYEHPFLRDPAGFGRGHLYSYLTCNNFRTNFSPSQVADLLFRYTLTTDEAGASPAGVGDDLAAPLVPVTLTGPQPGPLEPQASFCRVDAPNVHLLTLKAAEDGDGLILRLAEVEGRETEVTVHLPGWPIGQAVRCNLVEEDEGTLWHDDHAVRVKVGAHGLATVRCRAARCRAARFPPVALWAGY